MHQGCSLYEPFLSGNCNHVHLDMFRLFYDVHTSVPKRSIAQEVAHSRHGTKMPIKSEKGLRLVGRDVKKFPSPAQYSLQRPFGSKRPSRMTSHPEDYQAWHDMLDASPSAQQARLARESVLAVGSCIGSIFKDKTQCM